MILDKVIVFFMILLGSSLCCLIDLPKAKKQLDLLYSCMRVTTHGNNGDRAPILLLHGLGSFKETWMGLHQILALKTGRRVCVADLRNHGDSPWSDEIDIESMASDLNSLLKTLKTEKVVLLGHSLGGKISIHFSLKNPEKVEKLIIEDMRPNGITEEALRMISFSIKVLQGAVTALAKIADEKSAKLAVFNYLKETFAKANVTFLIDERAVDLLPIKCINGKCGWKMNVNVLGKLLENPHAYLTHSSGLFHKPALFVYGLVSPFRVGDDEASILKHFPKAHLIGIEGAAHVVHKKREFLDAVINFINLRN